MAKAGRGRVLVPIWISATKVLVVRLEGTAARSPVAESKSEVTLIEVPCDLY